MKKARSSVAMWDFEKQRVVMLLTFDDGESETVELEYPEILADSLMNALLNRKDFRERAAKLLRLDTETK